MEKSEIELPEELRKKVVILQCESEKGGSCNVYLVGTSHVSKQSCKDVEAIISFLNPDVVFLELCKTKVGKSTNAMVHSKYSFNAVDILLSLVMKKIGKEHGVAPGSEFKIACREAKKYVSKIVLGDRPRKITCQRAWSRMSFSHKVQFVLVSLLILAPTSVASLVENLRIGNHKLFTNTDVPISLGETLIYERDLIMASRLFEVAKECKSVVAVVGMGHVVGIQKNWKKPVDIESLMEVKAAKSSSTLKLWTSVALIAVGISFFSLKWLKSSE